MKREKNNDDDSNYIEMTLEREYKLPINKTKSDFDNDKFSGINSKKAIFNEKANFSRNS